MLGSIRLRLPRIGTWPRLLIAGTCLLLAAGSALGARHGAPAPRRTSAVVVAARDLPAGRTLTTRDVAVLRWPAPLRPEGARGDPSALLGRRLAGPVGAREPITRGRLVGADLAAGLPAGLVAAAVVLGDAHAADLVRAGDRVDLLETARAPDGLAAPPPRPQVRTLATGALVLAVLPASADANAELVVAVDRGTAVRIIRDTVTQTFTAVVVSP
jgi:Flp pilus assembly protein CpaB